MVCYSFLGEIGVLSKVQGGDEKPALMLSGICFLMVTRIFNKSLLCDVTR